jgi:GNAT superfamily N-acetyltransferase
LVGIERVTGRRSRREFLEFPYRLYRGHPFWVPPLRIQQRAMFDTRRHPFYLDAELERFLAVAGGRTLGRIAAIIDHRYIRYHDEQAGWFGFLEMVDDAEVAAALIEAAATWLGRRGIRVMRGPMNPSANYECALLVEGFDSPPCVMMPYNPPYYASLLERTGLHKAKDLYAYHTTANEIQMSRAERLAERAAVEHGVRVRPVCLKNFEAELELFFRIYNAAWRRNWGFAPMSRAEMEHLGRELKPVMDPDLVLLAEVNREAVGCALALPDINQALRHANGRLFPLGLFKILYYKRTIRRMRVVILGVLEEYRATGAAAALYAALFRNGRRAGYDEGEFSWVLEDNVMMNRSLEALGARRYKTYRIYEWKG